MLQADLKILGGKHQGKLISLNTKKFLVGREQDCHLRPNSELVSRHHCVFSIDDFSVRLRDLGSTNGTMVNGENIRGEIHLKAGDRITIGKLELEMVIRQRTGSASSSNLAPPNSTKSSPQVLTTAEMATKPAETDTTYTMQAYTPAAGSDYAISPPADTAIIDSVPPLQSPMAQPGMMPQPQFPGIMPPGYGMPNPYMPPGYPGYPQPGYGQMPGYPQQMGYPMAYPQMMPQQGYPGAAVAPMPAAPEPAAESPVEQMPIRLPDPSETGVKAPAPAPAANAGASAPAKKEEKPSTTAADIIKQYMGRRS